jgi:hypothetical protein
MSTRYSDQLTLIRAGNVAPSQHYGAKVRLMYFSFLTTGHVSGDTVELFKLPRNAMMLQGNIVPSATLGAACTVAIGWTGATGALRPAAVLTAADTFIDSATENRYTTLTAALEDTNTDLVTVFATYAVADPVTALTVKGHILYTLE